MHLAFTSWPQEALSRRTAFDGSKLVLLIIKTVNVSTVPMVFVNSAMVTDGQTVCS